MSGHSKWATTKHKKAVIDAKRGKMFAKLIKNVEVAARVGGGDPAGNPTLYDAIQKAKKSSVPNDNIDRAVKRGSGLEAGGADWQTIMYEGYGPSGVAMLIECLTDNRNRAAGEVRVAMTRNGGTMADPGSVAYLFTRKGVVIVPKEGLSEDDVLLAVLDAGAEEVNDLGDSFEVVSEATDLVAVRNALRDAGIEYDSADPTFLPSLQVPLDADAAREVSNELLALVERGLRELADLVTAPGGIEPQDGLERISTLFVQFTEFADSIRDFYAYLGQVLSRYDLDSAEYQGFKELLLDYVEAITEDVAFRAPRISAALDTLWPHIPALLDRLDAHAQGLTGLSAQGEGRLEVRVQRSRGRELADWEGLRGWFRDTDGQGSQVDQLRDATLRALQSLLANAKRMLRSATGEMSRRKDLLRLARWFEEAAPQDAHDIAVAAFGLYGARHLGIPPATDEVVPAYTSWWTGPVVEVPVALRERGSRAQRGRASAVEDHSAQKERLREAARQRAAARAAAADELRSASGRFADVRLTSAALGLLLELLATALGNAQLRRLADSDGQEPAGFGLDSARSEDAELGIRLTVLRTAGARTVLYSADGDLLLDDLELDISRIAAAVDDKGALDGEDVVNGEAEMSVS